MIHISNISKQYGNKILYKQASFQINEGEKIGLVGPNGAGKTTVFHVITGEEGIDQGQIAKSDKTVIVYFSLNIEDMRGRSALEEVKSAAGDLPKIHSRLQELQAKLAAPMADEALA